MVEQKITEEKKGETIYSTYRILLYQDNTGNLVITHNPPIWNMPKKSDYEPQQPESNGTVDSDTVQEVTEFLETIFTFYPIATEKELAYYVKNDALPLIEREYILSELINPIFRQTGDQIQVWLSVKYLDKKTQSTQVSQYTLSLEKDTNWLIVK